MRPASSIESVTRPVLSPSWLMRHVSDSYHVTGIQSPHVTSVMRPTRPPLIQSLSFSHRRPRAGHDDNETAAIFPCANAPRFAPVELYGVG